MQKVIDVRSMHTAIHSLYIVKRKPKTTLNFFKILEKTELDEIEIQIIWDNIFENVEEYGEIDFRKITGDKFWRGQELISENYYIDGKTKFRIIGSFDI